MLHTSVKDVRKRCVLHRASNSITLRGHDTREKKNETLIKLNYFFTSFDVT